MSRKRACNGWDRVKVRQESGNTKAAGLRIHDQMCRARP